MKGPSSNNSNPNKDQDNGGGGNTQHEKASTTSQEPPVKEEVGEAPTGATTLDIWALGIVIVLGGQYFSWNKGLVAGFWSFFIGVVLITIGYVTMVCSLAEMTSVLPFAGGAFGFSRVTHGTYMGFIVGVTESIEYIAYVSTSVLCLGQMITSLLGSEKQLEPVWWMLFYISALYLHIQGGRLFWRLILVCSLAILAILIIYCLGVAPQASFGRYAAWPGDQPWFLGGFTSFMEVFPLATWFYIGVEALPMTCEDTSQPRSKVPLGMVSCVWTLAITCLATLFACVSTAPGIEAVTAALLPLNYGYSTMFRASEASMGLLSIPATWATAFGFIYCYGRQVQAMASSGLLPNVLSYKTRQQGTPYSSLIICSIVGYALCVIGYLVPASADCIFPVCSVAAFITYICQMASYLKLQQGFHTLKRDYISPFGRSGAYIAVSIFSLALVAALCFPTVQPPWLPALISALYIFLASLYYFLVARHHQTFSPEETKAMFVAYVLKANMNRSKERRDSLIMSALRRVSRPVLAYLAEVEVRRPSAAGLLSPGDSRRSSGSQGGRWSSRHSSSVAPDRDSTATSRESSCREDDEGRRSSTTTTATSDGTVVVVVNPKQAATEQPQNTTVTTTNDVAKASSTLPPPPPGNLPQEGPPPCLARLCRYLYNNTSSFFSSLQYEVVVSDSLLSGGNNLDLLQLHSPVLAFQRKTRGDDEGSSKGGARASLFGVKKIAVDAPPA